jgi:glucose-6-phosphate isomerase
MSENNITIKYKETARFSEGEIDAVASTLSLYLGSLKSVAESAAYEVPESFLSLPNDKDLFQKTTNIAGMFSGNPLKYVIVVGIGGSNLGAAAVYDAVFPKFDILYSRRPKILFSDTNNPREMEVLKNIIDENIHESKEIVLNIITKSGTTVETVANAMVLFDMLSSKFGEKEAVARTVITTDEESPLWKLARTKGMNVLPIPKKIGGRYSIFSPAGIFPLRLAGVNVSELLSGATEIRGALLSSRQSENPALLCAVIDMLAHKKKLSIYNSFFFQPEMESVGKWGRQLLAESLGKKYDKKGNSVYAGMTPIISIGTTDLHSMAQLYLGGPKDKFTNFIYATGAEADRIAVPVFSPFESLVPDIVGKDFQKIVSSILGGTMETYKENIFPFIETVLPQINEYYLGQYFMMKMMETILLGKLWDVDPFDQPEVESYKAVARELLKK